jgi:hypothetical protein
VPIEVTEYGTLYAPSFPGGYKIIEVLFLLNITPFREEKFRFASAIINSVREEQP